jgi:hypothetical protein
MVEAAADEISRPADVFPEMPRQLGPDAPRK